MCRQVLLSYTVLDSEGSVSFADNDTVIFQTPFPENASGVVVDGDDFEGQLALQSVDNVQGAFEAIDAYPAVVAARSTHAASFNIVSSASDEFGNIVQASGNDLSTLVLSVSNADFTNVAGAKVISIYGDNAADEGDHFGDFFVTSESQVAITNDNGDPGARVTFNGYVHSDFHDDLDPFRLGAINANIWLHFAQTQPTTAHIPLQVLPEDKGKVLSYDNDGILARRTIVAPPLDTLPRVRGLWFDLEYQFSPSAADQFNIFQNILGITQSATDPDIDYRDYFDVGDLVELPDGGNYIMYQITSKSSSTSGGIRTNQMGVVAVQNSGGVQFSNGDDVRVATARTGILRVPVYSQNLEVASGWRLYRINLGRVWSDFDYLEIKPHEDASGSGANAVGFDIRNAPVPLLKTLGIVTTDNVDVRSSGLLHMSFRAQTGANNDSNWAITRATLTGVSSDQAIAYANQASSDDPKPLAVHYILQR